MARRKKIVSNIKIHGIADKGMSVGRDEEGMVYFVKGAVPGDEVDVLVLRKKKGYKMGVVHQTKTLSELRTEPFCEHFGSCGGCKWQNLGYEDQLRFKQKNVVDAVTRLAKMDATLVQPIIGSKLTKLYRNKMEYSFSTKSWLTAEQIASDQKIEPVPALGFHAPGTFDKIIDIHNCHLQDYLGDEIRNYVREVVKENGWTYYDYRSQDGFMRNLILRNSTLGEWMVNVVFGQNNSEDIEKLCRLLKTKFPQITTLLFTVNKKVNDTILDQKINAYWGPGFIHEQLGGCKYKISPKSFFQTNSTQAKVLYDKVVEMADLQGTENVYDLYTGTGSIALYLAEYCRHVSGIETVAEAIQDADYNKELNQITNADFVTGDVKDMLNKDFIAKYGDADVIVTDPPRAGMHSDVVTTLLQIEAKKIIYVSCNPATQSRDLLLLSEKYTVESVQPVDMFPHTSHVESIALLKLNQ